MANETSIYNVFEEHTKNIGRLNDKLDALAGYLLEKYKLKAYFCEIIGRRWSFYAGKDYVIWLSRREKLNENIGIIFDENEINDQPIDDIVCALKKFVGE